MAQIFISYAREDQRVAQRLYQDLLESGFDAWLDKKRLDPGVRWKDVIRREIRKSDYFVALLSKSSVDKKGYVQKELRQAIDILEEYPADEIFVIPLLIDECEPTHDIIRELQWLDLFPVYKESLKRLIELFKKRIDAPEAAETTPSITGTWRDLSDGDTCFFKQSGDNVVGFYDYDGRQRRVGIYIGTLQNRTLYYGWKWVDNELHGYGRMTLSNDGLSLSGNWWHGSDRDTVEHVGYKRISDEMPPWLEGSDFEAYKAFLDPSHLDSPEFAKTPILGVHPTLYDKIFWEKLSDHPETEVLFEEADYNWERLSPTHRDPCIRCHNMAMLEGWQLEPQALLREDIKRDPLLATEANLSFFLELVAEVHEYEGRELGGYDSSLQSYYEKRYSVKRNDIAFDAIKTIAKHNSDALTDSNRLRLRDMALNSLDSQVTHSTLSPGTSYQADNENIQNAKRERALILREVEELFDQRISETSSSLLEPDESQSFRANEFLNRIAGAWSVQYGIVLEHSETAEIDKNGNYWVGGQHKFYLTQIDYDSEKEEVVFAKKYVEDFPPTHKEGSIHHWEKLRFQNPNLLTGTRREPEHHKLEYHRLIGGRQATEDIESVEVTIDQELQQILWACYEYWKNEQLPPSKRVVCFAWIITPFEKRFGASFHQSRLSRLATLGFLEKDDTSRGGNRRYYRLINPDHIARLLRE